ncbi:hypothetical protein ACFL2Q_00840 [Thermodesulfobacteriota bacterium]
MVNRSLPVIAMICTVLAVTAIYSDRAACAGEYKIGLALPGVERTSYPTPLDIPKGTLAAKAAIEVFKKDLNDKTSDLRWILRWRFGDAKPPDLEFVRRYVVDEKPNNINNKRAPELAGTDEEIAKSFAPSEKNPQFVAVIGHTRSDGARKVTAAYNGKLVLITTTATHPDVVRGRSWVFSMTFNDDWLASVIAAYICKCISHKNQTVVVVYEDGLSAMNLRHKFDRQANQEETKLTVKTIPWTDESEVAGNIVQTWKSDKDRFGAIVLFTREKGGIALIHAIRNAGIKAPIVGTDCFAKTSFASKLKSGEEMPQDHDKESASDGLNVYAPNPFYLNLGRLETQRVTEAIFEEYNELYYAEWEKYWEEIKKKDPVKGETLKYKRPQFPNSAALWYDAALLLTVAIMEHEEEKRIEKERSNSNSEQSHSEPVEQSDRKSIRDNLEKINRISESVPGLSGTLYFGEHGGLSRDVLFSKVIDGKLIPAYIQLLKQRRSVNSKKDNKAKSKKQVWPDPYVKVGGETLRKVLVVFTGLDFYRINNVNLTEQRFDAEFLLWFRWKDDGLKPLKLLRGDKNDMDPKKNRLFFWNGIYGIEDNVELIAYKKSQLDGSKVSAFKVKSTFKGTYSLRHYPYDEQTLSVEMSLADVCTDEVLLATDERDTFNPRKKLIVYPKEYYIQAIEPAPGSPETQDGQTSVGNWFQSHEVLYKKGPPDKAYREWKVYSGTKRLQSSLGDPDISSYNLGPQYSVTKAQLTLKRILFPYGLRVFIPLGVLMLLSLSAFFVPVENLDIRITICITALLATIVFHLSQGESLPTVGYATVGDYYFVFAYVLMLVNTFMVIFVKWVGEGPAQTFATHLTRLVSVGLATGSAVCITAYGLGEYYWEWAIGTGVVCLFLLVLLCQVYQGFLGRACNRLSVFWPKIRRPVWAGALVICSLSMYDALWHKARWAPGFVAVIIFACVMLECIFYQDFLRKRFVALSNWETRIVRYLLTDPQSLDAPWAPVRLLAWGAVLIMAAILAGRGLIPASTAVLVVLAALGILEVVFSRQFWSTLSKLRAYPSRKIRILYYYLGKGWAGIARTETIPSSSAPMVRHCDAVASGVPGEPATGTPTDDKSQRKELPLNEVTRKTLERYRDSHLEQQDPPTPEEPKDQIDSPQERPLDAV